MSTLHDMRFTTEMVVYALSTTDATAMVFRGGGDGSPVARIVIRPDRHVALIDAAAAELSRAWFRIRLGKWAKVRVRKSRIQIVPWRWVYRTWEALRNPRQWWRDHRPGVIWYGASGWRQRK